MGAGELLFLTLLMITLSVLIVLSLVYQKEWLPVAENKVNEMFYYSDGSSSSGEDSEEDSGKDSED